MVAFGVYIEKNLVPEWRDQYLDYRELKAILKKLKKCNKEKGENENDRKENDRTENDSKETTPSQSPSPSFGSPMKSINNYDYINQEEFFPERKSTRDLYFKKYKFGGDLVLPEEVLGVETGINTEELTKANVRSTIREQVFVDVRQRGSIEFFKITEPSPIRLLDKVKSTVRNDKLEREFFKKLEDELFRVETFYHKKLSFFQQTLNSIIRVYHQRQKSKTKEHQQTQTKHIKSVRLERSVQPDPDTDIFSRLSSNSTTPMTRMRLTKKLPDIEFCWMCKDS